MSSEHSPESERANHSARQVNPRVKPRIRHGGWKMAVPTRRILRVFTFKRSVQSCRCRGTRKGHSGQMTQTEENEVFKLQRNYNILEIFCQGSSDLKSENQQCEWDTSNVQYYKKIVLHVHLSHILLDKKLALLFHKKKLRYFKIWLKSFAIILNYEATFFQHCFFNFIVTFPTNSSALTTPLWSNEVKNEYVNIMIPVERTHRITFHRTNFAAIAKPLRANPFRRTNPLKSQRNKKNNVFSFFACFMIPTRSPEPGSQPLIGNTLKYRKLQYIRSYIYTCTFWSLWKILFCRTNAL